ncbi:hypothetical protein BHE90_012478 [Fusarium euwallaceae]|uniref:Uncharacterized protein n=1 Tax=Fusarium euwallaceae TaxID=1147111 RepID=A0A430LBL2_9HYPO|nr:hypothetical protein BHE90_012478 [Fusarium euwallaceae]
MQMGMREWDFFSSPFDQFTTSQLCRRLLRGRTRSNSLHVACQRADINELNKLLEQQADLDVADEEGQTALHYALRSGSPEVVRALLEAGASPDPPCLPSPSKADLFFILFRLTKWIICYSVLAWIISKLGIDGSPVRDRSWGQLLVVELVAMMIFYILSQVTTVLGPCIGEAATSFRGNSEFMVLMLLDSGFRPQHRDMTLIWIDAAQKGYTGVCRRLADMGGDIDIQFEYPGSPYDPPLQISALLCACASSQADVVLLLLDAGADPALLDSWGRSCLLLTLISGDDTESSTMILKTLLSTGAVQHLNVNHFPEVSKKAFGWPLGIACERGRVHAVKTLLEFGADPNLQTATGWSVLHSACDKHFDNGIIPIIKLLLEHRVDVNAITTDSWTAIGRLCNAGISPEALDLLLEAGAEFEFGAGQNTPPLQIAARYDVSDGRLVELLLQRGADANALGGKFGSALLAALHKPRCSDMEPVVLKVVSSLLKSGANVNEAPPGLFTPILRAATQDWIQVVNLLFENEATVPPIKEVQLEGVSPRFQRRVIYVPILGYLDPFQYGMYELLLQHDASPNGDTDFNGMTGYRGKTILCYACSFSDPTVVKTARLLLDRGANPNGVDARERTPLQYAAYALSLEHVRMLLEHGAVPHSQETRDGSLWHSLCKGAARKRPYQARDLEEDFFEICKLFETKWSIDSIWTRDGSGRSCLHYLVELDDETFCLHGGRSTAATLIEKFLNLYGAKISPDVFLYEDTEGYTAFKIAARTGDEAVMNVLLSHISRLECNAAIMR